MFYTCNPKPAHSLHFARRCERIYPQVQNSKIPERSDLLRIRLETDRAKLQPIFTPYADG
jgi:hypothetical protein